MWHICSNNNNNGIKTFFSFFSLISWKIKIMTGMVMRMGKEAKANWGGRRQGRPAEGGGGGGGGQGGAGFGRGGGRLAGSHSHSTIIPIAIPSLIHHTARRWLHTLPYTSPRHLPPLPYLPLPAAPRFCMLGMACVFALFALRCRRRIMAWWRVKKTDVWQELRHNKNKTFIAIIICHYSPLRCILCWRQ